MQDATTDAKSTSVETWKSTHNYYGETDFAEIRTLLVCYAPIIVWVIIKSHIF